MGVRCAPGNSRTSGFAHDEEWLDLDSDLLAVHILTEDGFIAGTNRAFIEMFGTDEAEFIGKHQAVLNNHSVAANLRLLRDIRRQIDSAGAWRGILTNRDAGGTEFTSRAHIYPMRYGGVRRFVCFQQPESDAGVFTRRDRNARRQRCGSVPRLMHAAPAAAAGRSAR